VTLWQQKKPLLTLRRPSEDDDRACKHLSRNLR
jgi:hypothetical protein